MVAKAVLLFCAQALMIQSIAGQCLGTGWATGPLAAPWSAPCGAGLYAADALAPAAAAASYGGVLPIASTSLFPASGVTVTSENAYAGELAVRGALPFLGTVSLEGALPTVGAGAVAFGCGNGAVAILSEEIGGAGPLAYDAAIGPLGYRGDALGYGIGPFGYDAAIAGPFGRAGCGCGALI